MIWNEVPGAFSVWTASSGSTTRRSGAAGGQGAGKRRCLRLGLDRGPACTPRTNAFRIKDTYRSMQHCSSASLSPAALQHNNCSHPARTNVKGAAGVRSWKGSAVARFPRRRHVALSRSSATQLNCSASSSVRASTSTETAINGPRIVRPTFWPSAWGRRVTHRRQCSPVHVVLSSLVSRCIAGLRLQRQREHDKHPFAQSCRPRVSRRAADPRDGVWLTLHRVWSPSAR